MHRISKWCGPASGDGLDSERLHAAMGQCPAASPIAGHQLGVASVVWGVLWTELRTPQIHIWCTSPMGL